MYKHILAVAVLAGCGNDLGGEPPDAGGRITLPDGRVIDTTGDAGGTPDGQAMLTECEQAAQHADLAWIQAHIFTPSCVKCHGGPDPDVGLSLAVGVARAQLVNYPASTASGWMRVVPSEPARSYLLVAVGRGSGPPPQDGFMPLGEEGPLCTEKIDAIERWIIAGASN